MHRFEACRTKYPRSTNRKWIEELIPIVAGKKEEEETWPMLNYKRIFTIA